MLSVAVLEPDEGGLAELLAGQSQVMVRSATSVSETLARIAVWLVSNRDRAWCGSKPQ